MERWRTVTEMQTIDLDCPPGPVRPGDLIRGVIDGLDIEKHASEPLDDVTPFFGNACYSFDVPKDDWVSRVQPVIKPRIEALYHAGTIRYGSW